MIENWGFLCLKQEMTQLLLDEKLEAVTLLKFLDQKIIRIKTEEKDWYSAIIIWAGMKEKDWKTTYKYIKEFKVNSVEWYNVNDNVSFEILKELKEVKIKATTKGKWFQWVVKRFGFAWLSATHGNKYKRHPWGIGNRKPRRVNKNHPLPWHMWNKNITLKNVKVIAGHVVNNENIVVVKWSVPGSRNSLVRIYM